MNSDHGISLVEVLVAIGLAMAIAGATAALVAPMGAAAERSPAAADLQQRARVSAEVLARELLAAGAGLDTGPQRGPLRQFVPALLPRVSGPVRDPYTASRSDAVTILTLTDRASQTTLAADLPVGSTTLTVSPAPGCPIGRPACGLSPGQDAMVFDVEGHFDLVAILSVSASEATFRPHAGSLTHSYVRGAAIAAATSRSYYLDPTARTLRFADGYLTDAPLADHIVGLSIEYFGDAAPPVSPRPPVGVANCLFDSTGAAVALPVLSTGGAALAPLPTSTFSDGPWCGEGDNRFDADLLRVRRLRVTVRAEATRASSRGTSADYAQAGSGRSAQRIVSDLSLVFAVAPRNLSLSA